MMRQIDVLGADRAGQWLRSLRSLTSALGSRGSGESTGRVRRRVEVGEVGQ